MLAARRPEQVYCGIMLCYVTVAAELSDDLAVCPVITLRTWKYGSAAKPKVWSIWSYYRMGTDLRLTGVALQQMRVG